jgi:hypothetical protein
LHCWAKGPYLGKLPLLALFTSIISRLSDKLLRVDTSKWRETLADRERVKKKRVETVPDETATDIISKKLFLSPAKTIFKHKVESGVMPPGASANEQA